MKWLRRVAAPMVALAVVLGGVAACGGGGGGSDTPPAEEALPAVGPIPGAEFAKVPPPTFNQVIAAFRVVTTASPALLANEPALSRALFDEVKRASGVAVVASGATAATAAAAALSKSSGDGQVAGTVRRLALFNLDSRLTLEEWKLVIRSPLASARAAPAIELSAQAAIDRWACDADVNFSDGKADAFRHAYWNALMTRRTSAAFAAQFAGAHEVGSGNTAAATAMDLHNNAVGRALAERYPAAGDAELLQLLLQQPFTWVADGAALPGGLPGLAFISQPARRAFDGRFTGTWTEAGSASEPVAAWALEVHFAQCGATLRGQWRATRGAVVVERRFEGTVAATGSIVLAVADPFAFEPAAAQNVCLSLQVTLAGNEQALSGSWASAACPRGGTVDIRR
jgi:hypothetical protein